MNAVYQFERKIPVDDRYDVIVLGGGPAGTAAAISAARLGARVLLAEAAGCLGGMGTSGLVAAFDPMADGNKGLVGGLMREIVETLYERGELPRAVNPNYWRRHYHYWTPFNPESLKRLLDDLALDAGVEIRFFTRLIDADATGSKIAGVVLSQIDGLRYVSGSAFIDATGDAVLSDLCGAAYYQAGRDTPRIMPGSLTSLCTQVDWNQMAAAYEMHTNELDAPRPKPHFRFVDQAISDGHFSQADRHVSGMWQIGDSIGYINAGHLFNLSAVNSKDVTTGMIRGRKLAKEYFEFFKRYVPGCENIEMVATASIMGVRESRRIIGEYQLNHDDYLARRQFPDQIGVFNKFIDIHVYQPTEEEWARFKKEKFDTGRLGPGECFGLPYGMIVPKGWENLWVPGRSAASDVKVNGSIRVMPAAAMMGQAAGTAAVQSIRTGQPACDLNTEDLIRTLRMHGAILEQESLSPTMTRS